MVSYSEWITNQAYRNWRDFLADLDSRLRRTGCPYKRGIRSHYPRGLLDFRPGNHNGLEDRIDRGTQHSGRVRISKAEHRTGGIGRIVGRICPNGHVKLHKWPDLPALHSGLNDHPVHKLMHRSADQPVIVE